MIHSQINIQKLYIKKEQDKEKHFWGKYLCWDLFNILIILFAYCQTGFVTSQEGEISY